MVASGKQGNWTPSRQLHHGAAQTSAHHRHSSGRGQRRTFARDSWWRLVWAVSDLAVLALLCHVVAQLCLRALTAPVDSASVFVKYASKRFRFIVPQASHRTMNQRKLLVLRPVAKSELNGESEFQYAPARRFDAEPGHIAANHCRVKVAGERAMIDVSLAPLRLAVTGHPAGLLFPSVVKSGHVSVEARHRGVIVLSSGRARFKLLTLLV